MLRNLSASSIFIAVLVFGAELISTLMALRSNTLKASRVSGRMLATRTSSTETYATFQALPRVILPTLPTVYVYDHCPFCVRVRLALGVKNVKHNLQFLASDDVSTPTSLVGKKIAPILSYAPKRIIMPESLDIIAKIDSDPEFGPTNFIQPFSKREDLSEWQTQHADLLRVFTRPRYMRTYLPEFSTLDARHAFMKNHPMPGYSKEHWTKLNDLERTAVYHNTYTQSLRRLDELQVALQALDGLVYSTESVNGDFEGRVSYDDIDLWSRLRSLTLVQGLSFPPKLRAYLEHFARIGDVPLYSAIAC